MLRCASCGRENPDDANFCAACGARLVESAVREERKVVTVVFADPVGPTARGARLDPEDVRAVLAHFTFAYAPSSNGTAVPWRSSSATPSWQSSAHEDDAERAVRAALAIQDAIAELNEADPSPELEVRVKVNASY
jgi:class 3 adenylate cyclase